MEELREIAESYYKAGSIEVQSKAKEFFKSMNGGGNGKVDLEQFLTFMRKEGYAHMRNNSFFKTLDAAGSGGLGFMDVMTLFYIIKSGRPFCDSCGEFIPGIFFSCVVCFNDKKSSFNLCRLCCKSKRCRHNHDGRAVFLDNFTLLQATKRNSQNSATTQFPPSLMKVLPRSSMEGASASTSSTVSTPTDLANHYINNAVQTVIAQSGSNGTPQSAMVPTTSQSLRRSSLHRTTTNQSLRRTIPQNATVPSLLQNIPQNSKVPSRLRTIPQNARIQTTNQSLRRSIPDNAEVPTTHQSLRRTIIPQNVRNRSINSTGGLDERSECLVKSVGCTDHLWQHPQRRRLYNHVILVDLLIGR